MIDMGVLESADGAILNRGLAFLYSLSSTRLFPLIIIFMRHLLLSNQVEAFMKIMSEEKGIEIIKGEKGYGSKRMDL